jgi:hypothetical protein
MKKSFKLSLVFIFLLLTSVSIADVILLDYHNVDVCIKISNIDDYPTIALIEYFDCVAIPQSKRAFRIHKISCLRSNKICTPTIYAVKKEYIKDKDIKDINWPKDKNALKSNLTIKATSTETLEQWSSVELYYKIVGFTDTTIVLYKEKQVIKYENEKPDSVAIFKFNGYHTPLKQSF